MNDPVATPASTPRLCVFCGARFGRDPRWREVAREFGDALARRGWTLVYGGGHVGLMGALADGALEAGGQVHGIIPRMLRDRELAHPRAQIIDVVEDMSVRKQRMIEVSDAFVSLPGGLGTLDEFFEVLTLRQIGAHRKPSALLNAGGYWDGLLGMVRAMVDEGFASADDLQALGVFSDPQSLLDAFEPVRRARLGR